MFPFCLVCIRCINRYSHTKQKKDYLKGAQSGHILQIKYQYTIYRIHKVDTLYKKQTQCMYIKLFQLRLSPSKAEKSNTSAKGLLGIAKISMNF